MLRASAGRQAKELDPEQVKERLAGIVERAHGADEVVHERGANANSDRLKQAIGRSAPEPRQEQQRKLAEEHDEQRQLELKWQRERGRESD